MTAPLIVIMDGNIAFSKYHLKPNNIPMQFSWKDLIRFGEKGDRAKIVLPLSRESFFMFNNAGYDEYLFNDPCPTGPLSIGITRNGDALECYYDIGKLSYYTIPNSTGSFYARAGSWRLESAAAAASMLYDDIGKIYSASIRAADVNFTPFYIGNTKNIGTAISEIQIVELSMLSILNKYPDNNKIPKPEKIKLTAYADKLIDYFDNFETHAKLTLHNSPVKRC